MPVKFPFLSYPLQSFSEIGAELPEKARTKLHAHVKKAKFSVRLLRYWWAGQALAAESKRQGRALVVVDLGCERGWLKHFTPKGVVEKWIGLDWNPQPEVKDLAKYDEVKHANFDARLPLDDGIADVVVSLHVFEHLLRPGSTMAEVSRLLKPGGVFLGGTPTMPDWLARLREKHFRKQLQHGQVAAGGHITVLSPIRWESLVKDVGLNLEFITGSHAIRLTGSRLENWRWWIRLNQLWGALFPSLGSECYLQARRDSTTIMETDRLAPEDPHNRKLWIALGATTTMLLIAAFIWAFASLDHHEDQRVLKWVESHRDENEKILVWANGHEDWSGKHDKLVHASSLKDVKKHSKEYRDSHLLVSSDRIPSLMKSDPKRQWKVDSRLEMLCNDYLLLKRTPQGTCLTEYFNGIQE